MLQDATLEEALGRVVINLKQFNALGDAIRRSRFLNYADDENPNGILPDPDDTRDLQPFTSGEWVYRVAPHEGAGNGHFPHTYNKGGERHRFFSGSKLLSGKAVYAVSTPSTNSHWNPDQTVFRMQALSDAAKENGAEKFFAVFSELPFARQDRGAHSYNRGDTEEARAADRLKHAGQGVTSRVVLNGLIANGCDGLVIVHGHSGHLEKMATDCLENLGRDPTQRFVYDIDPTPLIAHYLMDTDIFEEDDKANSGEGIIFVSPDLGAVNFVGAVRQATGYSKAQFAYIDKTRLRANDPNAVGGILRAVDGGEIDTEGRVAVILDDMIDTFGTMTYAAGRLPPGIRKVAMYATHGIFSGKAEHHLRKQPRLTDVVVMDTRPSRVRTLGAQAKGKVTILKPAAYIAHALANCVESGLDPIPFYGQMLATNPSHVAQLYTVKRFDQHYRNRI